MTQPSNRQLWAYLLIGLGVLFLMTNLGWFGFLTGWLWGLLFTAGGLAFLYLYNQDRSRWWAIIPGFGLLAIGVAALSGNAAGSWFLGILGLAFAAVYLGNKKRWWAIIPAGALLTLAMVAWWDGLRPAGDSGWLFFLGIALTFGVLFFLPENQGKQRWAIYPALASLALGLVTIVSSHLGSYLIAGLLILIGMYLVYRQGPTKIKPPTKAKEA